MRAATAGLCEAGLCSNGPLPAWGYRYTVTIATDAHNQAPMSPTSEEFVTPLPIFPATVHSYLTGVGANVSIVLSHDTTQPTGMPPHPLVDSSPFSLAYGGAGGSFGGVGGVGHARHAPAQPYLQAVSAVRCARPWAMWTRSLTPARTHPPPLSSFRSPCLTWSEAAAAMSAVRSRSRHWLPRTRLAVAVTVAVPSSW